MFSRCLKIAASLLVLAATPVAASELKVCLDPDNMPLSNRSGQGFENRIVAIIADEIGASVSFVWWNDRHKPPLAALKRGLCDLVPDALANAQGVATTQPYLRSAYAFVSRKGPVASLDDAALGRMRIGVQSIGDDAVSPPGNALLRRGLGANLQPFSLRRHYSDPNSSAEMVAAVADGQLDVAALWGPFAGFYASRHEPALTVSLIHASTIDPPMAFDLAMAVRKDQIALHDAIDHALTKRRADINAIFDAYNVPRLPDATGQEQ
jgi:mxaJ protein